MGVFIFEVYDGEDIACLCGSNRFVPSPSLEEWFKMTESERYNSVSLYFCDNCGRRFIDINWTNRRGGIHGY